MSKEFESESREITREEYLSGLEVMERTWREVALRAQRQFEMAVGKIQKVQFARMEMEQATNDNQIVKFHFDGKEMSMTSYPKPPAGFRTGGGNG